MATQQKSSDDSGLGFFFFLLLLAIASIVETVRIAMGNFDELRNVWIRIGLMAAFCLWAVVYLVMMAFPKIKVWVGGVEIFVGLGLNWYQLSQLAEVGLHQDPLQRCTVITGGILTIYKGIKDWSDGLEEADKEDKRAKEKSTVKGK